MIAQTQYKLIKILCDLCDGENYVKYSEIKKLWPDCPSINAISNICDKIYIEENLDTKDPGYFPTPAAIQLVRTSESGKKSHNVAVAALIVGLFTLAATIATLFLSFR